MREVKLGRLERLTSMAKWGAVISPLLVLGGVLLLPIGAMSYVYMDSGPSVHKTVLTFVWNASSLILKTGALTFAVSLGTLAALVVVKRLRRRSSPHPQRTC